MYYIAYISFNRIVPVTLIYGTILTLFYFF